MIPYLAPVQQEQTIFKSLTVTNGMAHFLPIQALSVARFKISTILIFIP
jgi:hypothetical protein